VPADPDYFVHPSSVIDPPAHIGAGTRVWHFCHVMAGARIGRECVLGQNVFVAATAVLGDRVHIQNNVSVYDGVVLEDEVFCGPSVVFTNVRTPRTFVSRRDAYEPTRVCRGASLGANATVICGATIGAYALVGAGAVVTCDVPPHGLVYGNPARLHGWVCTCGEALPTPVPSATCRACARAYTLTAGGLQAQ